MKKMFVRKVIHINWINAEDFSFNSFLLMDRWIIRMILNNYSGWPEFMDNLAVALAYNPVIVWYFSQRCPETKEFVQNLIVSAPGGLSESAVRKAEVSVIQATETSIVYFYPDIMENSCDYIYNWDSERLHELVDCSGKLVLDLGSRTGRLAFAAAEKARRVYASEPVDMLREFMRDKIERTGVNNITVVDGTADKIPYEDNTFDIVMSGHVVGDDYERELTEITRVLKGGGYIIDCPGDDGNKNRTLDDELLRRGFEAFRHVSKSGGQIYRYRKQVFKAVR
jgi:ubiquinone/menaquinone biosynthesis C-methylase UbiE